MSVFRSVPDFSTAQAQEIASRYFGVTGVFHALPSERDQNYRITCANGDIHILKIGNSAECTDFVQAQHAALARLQEHAHATCPPVRQTLDGDDIALAKNSLGQRFPVRMVGYVPGVPMGGLKRHSRSLLTDLGRCVGVFDRTLANFDHSAMRRVFDWDLVVAPQVIARYRPLIRDPFLGPIIDRFLVRFEENIAPNSRQLRKSVIHNDVNDYNVIVAVAEDPSSSAQNVAGIIDFGDMVYSYTVADLAVAIAYAVLDKNDPLSVAAEIVRGYHREYPLLPVEFDALFDLIVLRLCVSVAIAAHQQQQDPDNDYLGISQQPISNTLPKLAGISPALASAVFRETCGLTPTPSTARVVESLRRQEYFPLLGTALDVGNCLVLDLAVGSALIAGDSAQNASVQLGARISSAIAAAGAEFGVGRYDEPRTLYQAPAFEASGGATDERRTIHLGMDLFAPAGTPLYAPMAGRVHAFNNNDTVLDYGPVIILRHDLVAGGFFHTLYGHLSTESLKGLYEGKVISSGERFASLGASAVNGGWPPHVHFQLITDLLDLGVDFPGVARPDQREVWKAFSPDPNLLLRVPETCFPAPAPTKAQTLRRRNQLLGRNLSVGYENPVKLVRGYMQYLYDQNGRRYLDAYNNVPHVGHCHPRVVEAGQRQMAILNTNTRYLHDSINDFAEALTATLPGHLSVCYFLSSASEANELALRMARACTGQKDTIVLEAAYHGNTSTLIDISPYKHAGPGGDGAPDWVHVAPVPDVFRGEHKADDPQAGARYAESIARITRQLHGRGRGLAALIAESCPSVAGQIIPPPGYLHAVYRHVRAAGGLCIADEVQTAYGRTGNHFYAFEAQGVVPDIVILGKPIGNGHPLAALVTTPQIADGFDNGMEFFATFGGNTVSCEIGKAVLRVTLEEGLQARALHTGSRILEGLRSLKDRYAMVADARGSGLFLGMELVKDRDTLEPAPEAASFVINRMRDYGVLLSTDGPWHNVVKIRPPLAIEDHDADVLVERLEAVFEESFSRI